MDHGGAALNPSLSGLSNLSTGSNEKLSRKRNRYRRCRSAPVAACTQPHPYGPESLHRSRFISRKLHPNVIKVIASFAIYLGVGTLIFYLTRHHMKGKQTNGVLDALYFCIVTMSTVGYGDLVPNSVATKLLACAFVFTGMALIALGLSKAADYLVEKQEMLLVKALHITQNVGTVEMMKEMETNRVKYKCLVMSILLVVIMIAGTVFLAEVEGMSFVDAFYCVCCTISTLGYGDVSFTTKGGRVFAIFYILTGTITLAQLIFYIAELSTERRQKKLVKWVLGRQMTKLDLEAADLDEDGVVE